jgi:hypothetical protein
MPRSSKSNVPGELLHWTIERAGIDFGLAANTLRKALAKSSAIPDADGLFTTKQIVAAIHGSMDIEKLATQKELRRKLELQNAIAEASVLNRSELMKILSMIADAMRTRIMSDSEMSRSAKEDILKDIASIPLLLKEVAHAQSRLPRGNGAHPESEGEER